MYNKFNGSADEIRVKVEELLNNIRNERSWGEDVKEKHIKMLEEVSLYAEAIASGEAIVIWEKQGYYSIPKAFMVNATESLYLYLPEAAAPHGHTCREEKLRVFFPCKKTPHKEGYYLGSYVGPNGVLVDILQSKDMNVWADLNIYSHFCDNQNWERRIKVNIMERYDISTGEELKELREDFL